MKPILTLSKNSCRNLHLLNLPCLQLTLGRTLFHLKRVEVFELLDLFGLWPNMSPASTYAKSFIKLILDEADEGSLTN